MFPLRLMLAIILFRFISHYTCRKHIVSRDPSGESNCSLDSVSHIPYIARREPNRCYPVCELTANDLSRAQFNDAEKVYPGKELGVPL